MNRYRVLAAVDFSAPAGPAFDEALAIAARRRGELVAIQAVPADQSFDALGSERLALKTGLEAKAADAGVPFGYRAQHGDPADIILLHAASVRPDVIVIGSHQRRGWARWRAGSVSARVVAGADVPVLQVPVGGSAAEGRFRHVAVAVDLRERADVAAERALALTGDSADRITFLHVVPGSPSGVSPAMYRYGVADYQRHLLLDAHRRMQLVVPRRRPSRAAVHSRILRGDTVTEIGRSVASLRVDLLIVGAPRRGALARALFGSTPRRLSTIVGVPVLSIPDAARGHDRPRDAALPRAA